MSGPSPGLTPEMSRARTIGWTCIGCCPDYSTHSYGFHLPPSRLPSSDYSLTGSVNEPVGDYCSAIDITTTTPEARKYVGAMFARWDAGAQPVDMAEFIGSVDGRKVLYASWKKPGVVELYKGKGHDHWFHGSKFRALGRKDGRWLDVTGPFLGPILGTEQEAPKPQQAQEEDDMTPVESARLANVERYLGALFNGKDAVVDSGGGKMVTVANPLVALEKRLSGK